MLAASTCRGLLGEAGRETMTKDQANILIFMVGLIAGSLIVHAVF
jgi:hypothetical protein